MDEHGQKVAQAAADARRHAAAAGRRDRREVPGDVGAARRRARPVHPDDERRAQARRAGADRADLRAAARTTSTRRRTTAGTASAAKLFKQDAEIVDGKCVLHPTRDARVGGGAELVLPAERVHERLLAHIRASTRIRRSPRAGATRSSRCSSSGLEDISASRSRLAWGVPFPRPSSDGEPADHLRLVRRAAELPHRDRLPRRGLRAALAGAAARHRQGHHALPLRDLAGDARWPPASRCPSGCGRTASCCSPARSSPRAAA